MVRSEEENVSVLEGGRGKRLETITLNEGTVREENRRGREQRRDTISINPTDYWMWFRAPSMRTKLQTGAKSLVVLDGMRQIRTSQWFHVTCVGATQ